jgi:D-aminopeptidase
VSPLTYIEGPHNSITDVEGFLVGNAHDEKLKSGVSVLYNNKPFKAGVHIMGGAPGTRETELLSPDKLVKKIDSIVLSGGSAFGLDASSGVVDYLKARGRGFRAGNSIIPIVPSAILFDLNNGGNKNWKFNPYRKLGETAFKELGKEFQVGSIGAGNGATTGDLKGGLGTSSIIFKDRFVIGALVAVNAVGSTCFPGTNKLYADYYLNDKLDRSIKTEEKTLGSIKNLNQGSTTLGIVCTNIDFDIADLTRIATSSHAGIARAVYPSHTPFDGDLIFSASSGKISNKSITDEDLMLACHFGAVCITKAIGNAIKNATSVENDLVKVWKEIGN